MDSEKELNSTVHHLCGMLRTVKTLNKTNAKGRVADALAKHLKGLTLADLGIADAPVEVPAVTATPAPAPAPVAHHHDQAA